MRCKIYIPFQNYDAETGFNTNITFTEEEYVNYITSEYNRNKLTFDDMNNFSMGAMNQNNTVPSWMKKKEKVSYIEGDASLLDIDNNEETIDNLLGYFKSGEMFIEQFFFDENPKLEDIYDEFKIWFRESEQINRSSKLTDDENLRFLPKKEFKVSFGEKSNAILHDCRLMERFSSRRYAVLVDKIEFVNILSL